METRETSRKNLNFYRGVLESAGLAEVAFYLNKSRQNLSFAEASLDGTKYEVASERVRGGREKISRITSLISEVAQELDLAQIMLSREVEKDEEESGSED